MSGEVRAHYETILKRFPDTLSPCKRYQRIFWLARVGTTTMAIRILCPHFPEARNIQVTGDRDILNLISANQDEYQEICLDTSTVLQYMIKLSNFLKKVEQNIGADPSAKSEDTGRDLAILEEIEKVGFSNLTFISEDLLKVQFSMTDEMENIHKLDITIPPEYPSVDPTPHADLPSEWTPLVSKSFLDMYVSWIEAVVNFVPVWHTLAELDRVCWVLDPDPPSPRHLYRRIAIAPSLCIQIEVDPSAPNQLPAIKFFGPDWKVTPLREKLCVNSEEWDFEDPLLTNLERILDLDFPGKMSVSREDLKVDCWICYSYHLDNKVPSVICRTKMCAAFFHQSCLYQWLKSVPETRTTLETLFGDCPYCKSPINVGIPK